MNGISKTFEKMRTVVGISKVYPKNNFSAALFSTVSRYSETEGRMVPDSDNATVRGPLTGKPYDQKNKDNNANDECSGLTGYAKEGIAKAADTVTNAGEKAKETADDMWRTTKDTAKKVKDTVADGESKADEVAQANYEPTNRPVDDLRNRDGGYDY